MKKTSSLFFVGVVTIFLLQSCSQSRIHDREDLEPTFIKYGIYDVGFMMRDHTHDELYFYDKERCMQRFSPASTFKIFNSLVALETGIAPDDQLVIKWDSVTRNPKWDHDMTMREAFKVSNVPYYQELARRIGKNNMQHYLDTAHYGNKKIGDKIDQFWLNDTLQISADEQLGLLKKLYFDELPFAERSQRIVRSMMLQEDSADVKYYYKTGTYEFATKDSFVCWIEGFMEHVVAVNEPKKSMNKGGVRTYPYFFVLNFTVPATDIEMWSEKRLALLHELMYKLILSKQ
jgi:beta-lactamase class D